MSAIQIPRVQAATLLRPMSTGRTKPCLMLCAGEGGNDCEAVIKWRGGKEMNERGLVCELMASMLALDLDLPVPKHAKNVRGKLNVPRERFRPLENGYVWAGLKPQTQKDQP